MRARPHRAPRSGSPLVRLAPGKVVPGVWWWRERSGFAGAGRALGHGAVLLRGWPILGVALAAAHFLLAEVDAEDLPRRLALAARYRTLQGHAGQPWAAADSPDCGGAWVVATGVDTDYQSRQFKLNSSVQFLNDGEVTGTTLVWKPSGSYMLFQTIDFYLKVIKFMATYRSIIKSLFILKQHMDEICNNYTQCECVLN